MMEKVLIVLSCIFFVGWCLAFMADRKREAPRKPPSVFRPKKRFERKMRGWHLKPKKEVITNQGTGYVNSVPVDHKNWIRVYPNPGYRINGWHWCKKTHKKRVKWSS